MTPGPGKAGSGVIYTDDDPFTVIQERYKTSTAEDALIENYLKTQLGNTGPYNIATNNCRNYSQEQFRQIKAIIKKLEMGNNYDCI
jgi:hypothetical protein